MSLAPGSGLDSVSLFYNCSKRIELSCSILYYPPILFAQLYHLDSQGKRREFRVFQNTVFYMHANFPGMYVYFVNQQFD